MKLKLSDLVRDLARYKNELTWDVFGSVLDERSWKILLEERELEISMEGFKWLGHGGLTWLITILKMRQREGLATGIWLPDHKKQLAYINYVALPFYQELCNFSFLNEYLFLVHSFEFEAKKEAKKKLSRIRMVNKDNWSQVINSTTQYVKEFILNRLKIDSTVYESFMRVDPFINTLNELVHNIAYHGGHEDGDGFGFVSFSPPGDNDNLIRYCFSDLGLGFQQTLRRKDEPVRVETDSHLDAILEGVLYRFRYPRPGVMGYYPTLEFIRERDGVIGIRSGDCLVTIDLSSSSNQSIFDKGYAMPTRNWLRNMSDVKPVPRVNGSHIYVDLKIEG